MPTCYLAAGSDKLTTCEHSRGRCAGCAPPDLVIPPSAALAAGRGTGRRPRGRAWAGRSRPSPTTRRPSFWNPGGLASGAFFSLVLDRNTHGRSIRRRSIALGTPPLGPELLPHRYRRSWRTAETRSWRTMPGCRWCSRSAIAIAVGATLKLVRGDVSTDRGPSFSTTKFDADLGVMTNGVTGPAGPVGQESPAARVSHAPTGRSGSNGGSARGCR